MDKEIPVKELKTARITNVRTKELEQPFPLLKMQNRY
jgi:hypothetical protein